MSDEWDDESDFDDEELEETCRHGQPLGVVCDLCKEEEAEKKEYGE